MELAHAISLHDAIVFAHDEWQASDAEPPDVSENEMADFFGNPCFFHRIVATEND